MPAPFRLPFHATLPRLSSAQPQAQHALKRPSWSSTLRLPNSSFPPRPVPTDVPTYLHKCTDDLYTWQSIHRAQSSTFTLHDGPPYANGPLHVGHALNKILKDIILRFQLSQGKRIHYVPGWDCHGLPIEVKALQGLGQERQQLTAMAVRTAAAQLASATVEAQMGGFRRWAVLGDWGNAYRTMEKGFELRQLRVFKEMVERGLVYRQFKPVYWSPSSRSALAEAELEYDDNHVSLAAYVKFPLITLSERLIARLGDTSTGTLSALIWTTTPWTLPANRAIAVHDDLEYSVVRLLETGNSMLVASSRVMHVIEAANHDLNAYDIVADGIRGADLTGSTYTNPLGGQEPQPIVHASYISANTGSGLVHTAPGHGFDDYNLCRNLGIEAFAPIDDAGCFTDAALPEQPSALAGKSAVKDGSQAVLQLLDSNGSNSIFHTHRQVHKYPIDWRTKQPVIMRATAQWFADVASIKDGALLSLENVNFLPESGRTRMENFISGRSEWCISRQRAWGVPIPALYRVDESSNGDRVAIMTGESVQHIMSIIEERGIDAWWTDAPDDPTWILPSLQNSGTFVRGTDTMDVWFDSGTSWTLLDKPKDPKQPLADVCLEGTDQHRGWFQSSLLTYVAHQMSETSTSTAHDQSLAQSVIPPYKTLITHGFTLDEHGHKMSKSLGNVISPDEIMEGTLLPPVKQKRGGNKSKSPAQHGKTGTVPIYDALGADALRLWVASADYTRDVVVGKPILQAINNSLHKYRVTLKWLLGVLADFSIPTSASSSAANPLQALQRHPFTPGYADRLAHLHLSETSHAVHAAYMAHEPYKAMARLNKYITHDLSAFYIETTKDPLYAGLPSEYLPTQATCLLILREILAMLAPVAPLLVTETASHASSTLRESLTRLDTLDAEGRQLSRNEPGESYNPLHSIWKPLAFPADATTLALEWSTFAPLHSAVKNALEQARTAKRMGSSLEAEVTVAVVHASSEPSTSPAASIDPGTFLRSLDPDTAAAMLVVSGFEVVSPENIGQTRNEEGNWSFTCDSTPSFADGSVFRVAVRRAARDKCPRCWRFAVPRHDSSMEELDAATDPIVERVCGRCEEALRMPASEQK